MENKLKSSDFFRKKNCVFFAFARICQLLVCGNFWLHFSGGGRKTNICRATIGMYRAMSWMRKKCFWPNADKSEKLTNDWDEKIFQQNENASILIEFAINLWLLKFIHLIESKVTNNNNEKKAHTHSVDMPENNNINKSPFFFFSLLSFIEVAEWKTARGAEREGN